LETPFIFLVFFSEWAILSLVQVYDEFRDFPLQNTLFLLYPSVHVKSLSLYAFRIRGLLCSVILAFETLKPEILKCWFHTLSPFGIRELLCVVVQLLKSQNPEMLVPFFSQFRELSCSVV
jgi:hypothetical protein